MKKSFVSGCFVFCLFIIGQVNGGIETSKHNLSVSGTGDIRAVTETRICVFCHIPHNASPAAPLWNRADPGLNYIPYTSSTVDALPGQPTGNSLLCLSCHDGTIALGELLSRDEVIAMTQGITTLPADRRTHLGTDLSDDHPVSFDYTEALAGSDGRLVSPSLLTEEVRLDRYGQLQCTSCHDPHDDTYSDFLVMDAANGALCETCHVIFHALTPHRNSTATWDSTGTDPWPHTDWVTVQENACFNCHTPHAAEGRERLLKYAKEEDNCLVCHNGHVTESGGYESQSDIYTVFQKLSVHPLDLTEGEHDPIESILVSNRHVECQDCHNGHAVVSDTGDLDPTGALNEIAGIDIYGAEVDPITHEYQLCFRCHGDTQEGTVYTDRLVYEPNVRLDFDIVNNPSYHPVAGVGRNPNVPSLISPLTPSSIIKCTDCHNNDDLDAGPAGPHGSDYLPLLERQYVTSDGTPESSTVYALCYKCHERDSILGNESFSRHERHIAGVGSGPGAGNLNTPCNVCHDPHGVLPSGGIYGPHSGEKLINFDLNVVETNSAGLLYYESTGVYAGACYLSCHGKNHNPCTYTSTGASCGSGGGGGGPGSGGGGGPGSGGG
jgi:predicted CXXCH cytochrome family protein